MSKNITRRSFLRGAMGAAAVGCLPKTIYAGVRRPVVSVKDLSLYNLHTDEKIALSYFENGEYVTEALRDISYLLRDFRTGGVIAIDPRLIDLLYDLKGTLGTEQPFQIISGYRSPKTNAALRKSGNGVAKKSFHMQGKAVDIRIEGIDSKVIQSAAMSLGRGGVGYYLRSNFVHIDTGSVRSW
ncbi:MAG: DUF882 domain-containing protein [Methyloprofundus sp.]|nr:DUF882 domain-containing protein [Methyloprofundus sp.]MDT8425373.1 DUF882 domain-containing protein [Methyloprofundus sp.]